MKKSYTEVINFFLKHSYINDIWKDIKNGSFIVWNKWFENSRNNEIWKTYPGLEYPFALINENAIVLRLQDYHLRYHEFSSPFVAFVACWLKIKLLSFFK